MKRPLFKRHKHEHFALLLFLAGGIPAMLGIIQQVHYAVGIIGIVILASGMFYYCFRLVSEEAYKNYYKESYEIEHESIEEEIHKSMMYHRYQEAMLKRYDSACRDLGISEEQKDWLLELLIAEKDKVETQVKEEGTRNL